MKDVIERLVDALRAELESYGSLLAVLDRQQELVFARQSEELYGTIGEVPQLSAMLHESRTHRDACRRAVCAELELPMETPFGILVPTLPADLQPLMEALVEENNALLVRLQQRARQNHLLLSRSVDLMQELIGSLIPRQEGSTYTGAGRGCGVGLPPSSVVNAVC